MVRVGLVCLLLVVAIQARGLSPSVEAPELDVLIQQLRGNIDKLERIQLQVRDLEEDEDDADSSKSSGDGSSGGSSHSSFSSSEGKESGQSSMLGGLGALVGGSSGTSFARQLIGNIQNEDDNKDTGLSNSDDDFSKGSLSSVSDSGSWADSQQLEYSLGLGGGGAVAGLLLGMGAFDSEWVKRKYIAAEAAALGRDGAGWDTFAEHWSGDHDTVAIEEDKCEGRACQDYILDWLESGELANKAAYELMQVLFDDHYCSFSSESTLPKDFPSNTDDSDSENEPMAVRKKTREPFCTPKFKEAQGVARQMLHSKVGQGFASSNDQVVKLMSILNMKYNQAVAQAASSPELIKSVKIEKDDSTANLYMHKYNREIVKEWAEAIYGDEDIPSAFTFPAKGMDQATQNLQNQDSEGLFKAWRGKKRAERGSVDYFSKESLDALHKSLAKAVDYAHRKGARQG